MYTTFFGVSRENLMGFPNNNIILICNPNITSGFFYRADAIQLHMLPERRNIVKYQLIRRNIYVQNNTAVNVHRCGYGGCKGRFKVL